MCTQEFRIRHINGVGIAAEFDILRSQRKMVPSVRVELEELVVLAFALL